MRDSDTRGNGYMATVMLDWQRDWARKEIYDAVTSIVKEHSGAHGMVIHAYIKILFMYSK